MPAKLIRSGDAVPIGFGSRPGFGISYGVESPYNTFTSYVQPEERYVMLGSGFGDLYHQASAATNFDDASLFPFGIYIVELGSHTSWISARVPPGATDPDFYSFRDRGTAGVGTRASDDGIVCYDASPTYDGSNGFNALYLGNRCQSYVGQFTLGQLGPFPSADTNHSQGGALFQSAASKRDFQFGQYLPGTLLVWVFQRWGSALNDLPSVPGWSQYTQVANNPTDPTSISTTLYTYRVTEADTTNITASIIFPTSFSGGYDFCPIANVDFGTPVEVVSLGTCDGTTTESPAITTLHDRMTVLSVVSKLSTNSFPAFGVPAGWTSQLQLNFGNPVGGANHWQVWATNNYATPSSTGPIAYTGASSSFGTGFTISFRHGPGLATPGAIPGNISFDALGFKPDLLLFTLCDPYGLHDQDNGNWMFGAADGTSQFVTALRSSFGSGPTFTGGILNKFVRYRRFKNDACLHYIGAPSQFDPFPTTTDVTASLVSMDADGFTLNISEDAYPSVTVLFMAVKANPGRGAFKVGNGVAPGGTGPQSFTGLGFQPDAIMVAGSVVTDTALHNDAGSGVIGASDGIKQAGGWMEAPTGPPGAGPPAPWSYVSDSHTLVYGIASPGPALLATASLDSLDADGFTLDWDLNDGAARLFGWVALQADSDPTLEPVAITDAVTDISPINITFHGRITPNAIPAHPVSYFFQIYGNAGGTPIPFIANSATVLDGSGTSEVIVTQSMSQNPFFFDPSVSPFCYRLVVQTAEGCLTYGQFICIDRPQARLTFGNKFRMEL